MPTLAFVVLFAVPTVAFATAAGAGVRTWLFFARRRKRADFEVFDRIMARSGGVPPEGDDIL